MVSEKQFDQLLSALTRIAVALERSTASPSSLRQAPGSAAWPIYPEHYPDATPSQDPVRTLPITMGEPYSPWSGRVPASQPGPSVRPVAADLYPPFSRSVNAPPSSSSPDGGAQPEPRKEDNRPTGDWR